MVVEAEQGGCINAVKIEEVISALVEQSFIRVDLV
jgi:hypothetical protein